MNRRKNDRVKPSDVHTTIMVISSLFLVISSQIAVTFNPTLLTSREILIWYETGPPGTQPAYNGALIFQQLLVKSQYVSLASIMLSLMSILLEFGTKLLAEIVDFRNNVVNEDEDGDTKEVTDVKCCCGYLTVGMLAGFLSKISFILVLSSLGLLIYLCFVLAVNILNVGEYVMLPTGTTDSISIQLLPSEIQNLQEFVNNGNYSTNAWFSWLGSSAAFWTYVLISEISVFGLPLLIALFIFVAENSKGTLMFVDKYIPLSRCGIIRFKKRSHNEMANLRNG